MPAQLSGLFIFNSGLCSSLFLKISPFLLLDTWDNLSRGFNLQSQGDYDYLVTATLKIAILESTMTIIKSHRHGLVDFSL